MMNKFRSLRRPKVFITVILCIAVIAAFAAAAHNLNSPANGIVTTSAASGPVDRQTSPAQKHFSDKLVSFTYPSKYSVDPLDKSALYLDVVNLISTARRDQYVAITLQKESLSNDSGVNYRKSHPDLYKVVTTNTGSVVFARTDQTEYTGYIQRGGEVAAISLTSVSPVDLSADYNQIASSLEWRQ